MSDDKKDDEGPDLGGRPPKFKPEYAQQVEKLCYLGATDLQLADFFNVAETTIYEWKKKHPEFSKTIKQAKIKLDSTVAKRLYQRASGYSHPEEKIFHNPGPEDGEEKVTRVTTTKQYPPDTASMIFWLKTRQRLDWREKQDQDLMDRLDQLEKLLTK